MPSTPTYPRRSASAAIWTPFLLLCLIAVAAVIRRLVVFILPPAADPTGLDAAFAYRRALTLAHILPALVLVLLLPFWFSRRVRARPPIHRNITHALFVLGLVVGITAIPMSFRPVGGITEASAVLFFDALFLFSLACAWRSFRRGDASRHRVWMLRAVAVLLGIATTRPVMGVFFATRPLTGLTLHQFFGLAFWIGFTVTYLAGEAYLRTHPDPVAAPSASR
ncbi:MAG TPA: DUF2306 domain-containing protein [Acidobacteriaceae bacterium]